ncbi:hypothetical protein M0802_005843 [Mischocyttarus mexicanus]|nr:hypothetical protein M0802_005843 [Mischocyttarus mexicanus]
MCLGMWNKVATDIISKRGVCCTINDHLTGYPTNWDEVKTNIIDKCSVKPVLHMCYDCGGLQGTFVGQTKEFIASNILRTLHKWYPRRVSSIWGGMVRKLTICKNNICNYNIDCIAMLLSGTNMQTWTIVMDGKMASIEYIEIRLNELKKEITFKKHSMGLMFSGDYCDNFYLNLEPDIFMRLFPDTPLFQVLGYLALGAQDCKEADNSISDGYRRMLELSLTIVTYD